MTVSLAVTYAALPCSVALYTCDCGATSLGWDVSSSAPDGWVALGDDVHLCPRCARLQAAAGEAVTDACP